MAATRDAYVTIPLSSASDEASPVLALAAGGSGEPCIVYQLPLIFETFPGTVLVAGCGSAARATVKSCHRFNPASYFVTGTQDKKRAFSFTNDVNVAIIGEKFDKRLFANEYALLSAAQECSARVILLADASFTPTSRFLMRAAALGCAVFAPLSGDKSHLNWSLCEYDANAEPRRAIRWTRCHACGLVHDRDAVLAEGGVCPDCGALIRLTAAERIASVVDEDSFTEYSGRTDDSDPLGFPGYQEKIAAARRESGLSEAVVCGVGALAGTRTVVCAMDSHFMMGSMGAVVGERLTCAIERATEEELPVVIFTCSGGARMQEGLVSLMQMAKVSAAIERHGRAGLLYVSVITDPTTGGVTASFAMEGDVILAEPRALVGFAGRRVIQGTVNQALPDGFQTAEFALAHGLIDAVVPRENLRSTLANILAIHAATRGMFANGAAAMEAPRGALNVARAVKGGGAVAEPSPIVETPAGSFDEVAERIRDAASAISDAPQRIAARKRRAAEGSRAFPTGGARGDGRTHDAFDLRGWESVQLARDVHRPTAVAYVRAMVDCFVELHGDRAFGDDGAIVAGIGWIGARAVTVIAEEKGSCLKQRVARNFGCPKPEGYRKALRLMRQAEKFGRPVVCLVDTQGAFCGVDAEERGQGNALADNLVALAGLRVPVVSVIVGEGGSGGALALAAGDRVAMQEHAVYSVLSPEGFASILWKDAKRAPEAAAVMKVRAEDARELGIVDAVIPEGKGPAHENPQQACDAVHAYVERALDELDDVPCDELLARRYARYRRF